MKKIRLTESELTRIVKRIVNEQKVDLELPTNPDVPVPDTNDDKLSPAMTHDDFMKQLDGMCPEINKRIL